MSGRQPAPVADVSFPVWKVAAVKALQQLHERAAVAMRERDWRSLYIRGAQSRRRRNCYSDATSFSAGRAMDSCSLWLAKSGRDEETYRPR
jgi:hypothetical protein